MSAPSLIASATFAHKPTDGVVLWQPEGSQYGVVWLEPEAESGLEAMALGVNAKENDKVLGNFPHSMNGFEVFLMANIGSSSMQVYNILTSELVAQVNGGAVEWTAEAAGTLKEALDAFAVAKRPTSVCVVGRPGYAVAGGDKWVEAHTLDFPATKWFKETYPNVEAHVLNRTKEAGFAQPNCDWASAYASLPMSTIRKAWPNAPERPERAVVVDLGGGYSRLFLPDGSRDERWVDKRPSVKANDVLFVGKTFVLENVDALVTDIVKAANSIAGDKLRTPLCIIATGKARDAALEARAAAASGPVARSTSA